MSRLPCQSFPATLPTASTVPVASSMVSGFGTLAGSLGERIAALLDPEESLPAAGQGALAVECRADRADVVAALAPLADRDTTLATTAERAFSGALSGSCHTPLAAYALFVHGELWLRGLLASRDGALVLRGDQRARCDDVPAADALGRALAADFLGRGAARLVAG